MCLLTALCLLVIHVYIIRAIDPSQCIAPLGMENGAIRDEDITASSSYDSGNVGPQQGRVRTERNGGAWCPLNGATTEPEEWLQVDLKTVHMITATGTQGRFGNGQGVEFAEAYILEYWRPRLNKWIRYHNSKGEEVLPGNINTYLESKHNLDPPILASKLRFYPYSYHKRTVCMRVELYGCRWLDGVLSYSMPQGDKRGTLWEFYDFAYDGQWEGNELRNGLGQLVDGKYGPDDFKLDLTQDTRHWVGWKNDSRVNKPVEVKFEFDRVREFSSVNVYCNNMFTKDVQIFAAVRILFSIGGKRFNKGDPIVYDYMEDRIFENARNVTIKLHHRVGKYVKMQFHFSAKWLLISEITFDSVLAHGNFSVELESFTMSPTNKKTQKEQNTEIPLHITDSTSLTLIVIGLATIIVVLSCIIYCIIRKMYKRKFLRSPNASHIGYPDQNSLHYQTKFVYNTNEKTDAVEAYGITEIGEEFSDDHGTTKSSLRSTLPLPCPILEDGNEYQEPYQALKYAPYYSYSSAVMQLQDESETYGKKYVQTDVYDYVLPEAGTLPLLSENRKNSFCTNNRRFSSSTNNHYSTVDKSSLDHQQALASLKRRLEEAHIPKFPKHNLRMLSKLSEGTFGTVYIAEADKIPEYATTLTSGPKLVALKFLGENSLETEKKNFLRDIRILSALEDPNLSRVLGICADDEPLCVIMEYLDHGDLCQFLKSHIMEDPNTSSLPKTLSLNCLLYMGAQIASAMRYLECLNFVHRDVATRNCLVGKAYQVKVCDFGTFNELYVDDYYKVDGSQPLPIRWMAWEAVYQSRYTTKSDVWSFAVTLWEILTLCRMQPYEGLTDPLVMENLMHMHCDDGQYFYLPRPKVNKDIYDLMLECWRRNEVDRPNFTEIHLFLQRKNLGYAPT